MRIGPEASRKTTDKQSTGVRPAQYPKSDIDLAVEGCPDFPEFEGTLQDDLWSLLQVDVVNLDGPGSQALRDAVAWHGRVLYGEV